MNLILLNVLKKNDLFVLYYKDFDKKTDQYKEKIQSKLLIDSNVFKLEEKSFSNIKEQFDLKIPRNVIYISNLTFEESGIETLQFDADSNVSIIPIGAFYNADNLVQINIPKEVDEIQSIAFKNAKNLKTVSFDIGSKLSRIGDQAFFRSINLESIAIPKSVISIGESAFAYNDNLQKVTFENNSIIKK